MKRVNYVSSNRIRAALVAVLSWQLVWAGVPTAALAEGAEEAVQVLATEDATAQDDVSLEQDVATPEQDAADESVQEAPGIPEEGQTATEAADSEPVVSSPEETTLTTDEETAVAEQSEVGEAPAAEGDATATEIAQPNSTSQDVAQVPEDAAQAADPEKPIDTAYAETLAQYPKGGYVESPFPAKSIHDENEEGDIVSAASLPSYYNSADFGYVTSVRNQSGFGICWIFAMIAPIESYLLRHASELGCAYDRYTLDLSEQHLLYFTFNMGTDPMGNTRGDYTAYDGDLWDIGGAFPWAIAALSSWVGPVLDSRAPLKREGLPRSMAYENEGYVLSDARQIPFRDRSDVKRAIMEYGALGLAYVDGDLYHSPSDGDCYYWDGIYRSDDDDIGGHSVTLVGWDDNFSRDNFGKTGWGIKPSHDGAWLCKNSWGEGFGRGGFFWISYEDASFGMTGTGRDHAWAYKVVPASKYHYNYQYDGSVNVDTYEVASGGAIANVYKVSGGTPRETLKAVSFNLNDTNVDYSIQVYANPTSSSNPASGTPLLKKPQTGHTSYVGLYTVDLDEPVILAAGSRFSVVVTLSHANGSKVGFFIDSSFDNGWCHFYNSVTPGQSYARSGGTWVDLAYENASSARLKAFTVAETFPDVPEDHWAFNVINKAAAQGIVSGYKNGRFGPNDKVTRGQAVTMLWNMAGRPSAKKGGPSFADVKSGAYYYASVRWAASVGVVHGYANGTFGPDDYVTRQQLAVMLANYATKMGGVRITASPSNYAAMSDAGSVSAYAQPSVAWCYENKVMTGSNGTLRPQGTATRAETCKMVTYLDNLV